MSLSVIGKAKVYQYDNKGNYAKASLQVGKKKQDGEWENMWFNAKFVKNVPATLEKGQQIEITSSVLESFKGEKGTYITVVIFDFNMGQKPSQNQSQKLDKCPGCGKPLSECTCDDLPF